MAIPYGWRVFRAAPAAAQGLRAQHPLPHKKNTGDYKDLGIKHKIVKLSYQQKKAKIKQKIAYGLHQMSQ